MCAKNPGKQRPIKIGPHGGKARRFSSDITILLYLSDVSSLISTLIR